MKSEYSRICRNFLRKRNPLSLSAYDVTRLAVWLLLGALFLRYAASAASMMGVDIPREVLTVPVWVPLLLVVVDFTVAVALKVHLQLQLRKAGLSLEV